MSGPLAVRSFQKLRLRLRSLFRRGLVETELAAELAFHFDQLVAENVAAGMAPREARYAARRTFGGAEQIAEACREMRRTRPWEELAQDLAYAARTLRRSPVFTLVAVLSLALGIGANTAVASLLHAFLLRPLPVHAPEELVAIGNPTRIASLSTGSVRADLLSWPMAREIVARSHSFSGVLASGRTGQLIVGDAGGTGANGRRESVRGRLVSGSYFAVLGVDAVRGRTFTADDDRIPGAAPYAVLSHDYWQRRFAGNPRIVGSRLLLNGSPFTVIGVARPGFSGEIVDTPTDVWLPLSMQPQINPGRSSLERWDVGWLLLLGRLKPGVSLAAARGEVNSLFSQIATGQLSSSLPTDLRPDGELAQVEVTPGAGGFSRQRRELREPLFAILAMVLLVLVIACANIANLLLERAVARQKEVAVRLALGAGRARLIRQFLTESLVLAALGGSLGALAAWLIAGGKSTQLALEPNLPVLGFTAAVVVATGLLFGLAPALGATRVELAPTLKENARSLAGTGGAGRWPLGKLLVISQLAFSFLLLAGAGLFVGTLRNLERVELGFPRDEIVLVHVDPLAAGYADGRMATFPRQLVERLRALPGVTGATFSENGVFSGTESGTTMRVEGVGTSTDPGLDLSYDRVGPRYFETLGVPVLRGRDIGPQDGPSAPRVAVINETFRKHYFADRDPLGRHLSETEPSGKSYEIVGVAADVHDHEIRGAVPPRFYLPLEQTDNDGVAPNFAIRTHHPANLLAPIARALQAFDPHLPFDDPRPLGAMVGASIRNERTVAGLATAFGLVALLLAAIGLYGVISYTVARRTHEIGIRMALGSTRAGVLWRVLAETLALAAVGILLGIPLALGLARLVASRLFGLEPTDPATLAAAILTLVAVAALAGALPGTRATRIEPVQALRYE